MPGVTTPDTPTGLGSPDSPAGRFIDGAASTFGKAVGFTLGACTAIALVLLVGFAFATGAVHDVLDQNQYQDRLDAIDAVYRQGVEARETLARNGLSVTTEAACETAMRQVGAHKERDDVAGAREIGEYPNRRPDTEFANLRRLSFINGCMGRPNILPPIPLPDSTPASAIPSPSGK